MASDKDLNEYMGIKKYAPYRKEKERWDPKRGEKLKEFKSKIKEKLPNGVDAGAIHGDGATGERGERQQKKRKGKKERMREKAAMEGGDVDMDEGEGEGKHASVAVNGEEKAHKKDSKRKMEEETQAVVEVNRQGGGEAEQAKKKRRRHKKSGKGEEVEVS